MGHNGYMRGVCTVGEIYINTTVSEVKPPPGSPKAEAMGVVIGICVNYLYPGGRTLNRGTGIIIILNCALGSRFGFTVDSSQLAVAVQPSGIYYTKTWPYRVLFMYVHRALCMYVCMSCAALTLL